jgi:hypothetical protein
VTGILVMSAQVKVAADAAGRVPMSSINPASQLQWRRPTDADVRFIASLLSDGKFYVEV